MPTLTEKINSREWTVEFGQEVNPQERYTRTSQPWPSIKKPEYVITRDLRRKPIKEREAENSKTMRDRGQTPMPMRTGMIAPRSTTSASPSFPCPNREMKIPEAKKVVRTIKPWTPRFDFLLVVSLLM